MTQDYQIGVFRGRKLIQKRGEVGGAKSVFVKLQGIKNELVYPTFGGVIKNPFKGAAKMFAGDLCEYRTNEDGVKPEIYLLKTYNVLKVTESPDKIYIERDGYRHKPFVGDKLARFIDDEAFTVTITSVVEGVEEGNKVWICDVTGAVSGLSGNTVLVDYSVGKIVPNAVIDCDIDMLDAPATGDDDFDGARYHYTPALGGIMYINKMSPLPSYVKELNQSKINGWFQIQSV